MFLSSLESLVEAERSLVKAEAVLSQYSKLSGGGGEADPSLGMKIAWAMGTLSTKQKKYDLAKVFLKKVLLFFLLDVVSIVCIQPYLLHIWTLEPAFSALITA